MDQQSPHGTRSERSNSLYLILTIEASSMSTNVRSLISKLNDATRSALEAAAGLCLSRTHYDIEIEHLLMKLLDAPGTDVPIILKQFGLDKSRVTADLTRSLDRLKSGNARTPSISPTLLTALKEGWNIGSLAYGAGQVRSGFILLAALNIDELHRLLQDTSREFEKIPVEGLQKEFLTITQMSAETASPLAAADTGGMQIGIASVFAGHQPRIRKDPSRRAAERVPDHHTDVRRNRFPAGCCGHRRNAIRPSTRQDRALDRKTTRLNSSH